MASITSRTDATVTCSACRLCGSAAEAPWHLGEAAADLNFLYEPCGLPVRSGATGGRCISSDCVPAPDHRAAGHHHHRQWEHATLERHSPGCSQSTAAPPPAVELTSIGCCAASRATGDAPEAEAAIAHDARPSQLLQ
jgi:hypothetical protein